MVDAETTSALINELENLAHDVLYLKRSVLHRRPIIIEFCGTPKSGKTSCITSLVLFLKRNNFITKTLTERAGVCPINDKYDPSFNIWTMCSAISELVELLSNHSKEYDVILLDRGIFDALVWFRWLYDNNKLDKETFRVLSDFLTLGKWTSIIDITYVFEVKPEISIHREYANLLTRKTGSIMQPDILQSYNIASKVVLNENQHKFRNVIAYDTSNEDQNTVNYNITKNILTTLKDSSLDRIGYVRKDQLPKNLPKSMKFSEIFNDNVKLNFGLRNEVENNSNFVQPIPIVVITNPERDKILVVKKNKSALSTKSPEKDKLLTYLGGHIRQEDRYNNQQTLLDIAHQTLSRELKEEISINLILKNNMPHCIWIRNHETSSKHLAMCFIYETDLDILSQRLKLDKKEFVVGTQSKSGKVLKLDEIDEKSFELEAWSKNILRHYFDLDLDLQIELFA